MIKAVIFDMDGVLIDDEMVYLEHDLEFARSKNPDVTLDMLFGMVGAPKKTAFTCMANAIGNGQGWEELSRECSIYSLFDNRDYSTVYRKSATEVLKSLKTDGYKLALASSTQMDMIKRVLLDTGIEQYFDVIVSGEQFSESKPDPQIYHYTAARLGVDEKECLVIEDSTLGIQAGVRAGMTVIALKDDRFDFDQSPAAFRIDDLTEILGIVDALKNNG